MTVSDPSGQRRTSRATRTVTVRGSQEWSTGQAHDSRRALLAVAKRAASSVGRPLGAEGEEGHRGRGQGGGVGGGHRLHPGSQVGPDRAQHRGQQQHHRRHPEEQHRRPAPVAHRSTRMVQRPSRCTVNPPNRGAATRWGTRTTTSARPPTT